MQRSRATSGTVLWALSIGLAALFMATGISKLTGTSLAWLEPAGMQSFPSFIRIVVGVVEAVCGVSLLIPGLAFSAALCLAFLMIPAAISQLVFGQPGVWIPLLLLLLLLIVAWMREPATVRTMYVGITTTPRPVLREGVIAGLIGATCVAVWFFAVDVIAGHPLFTPTTLGRALFTLFRPPPVMESPMLYVVGYTIFHYAAFIFVGTVAAAGATWGGREPELLWGFSILFVTVEAGFYWFVALLQQASPLGGLAWPQVMIGNLISVAAMGSYIWRHHPRLREQFTHALDHSA